MTNLAVDIFLSLDIARYNRELELGDLPGHEFRGNQWSKIESAMSVAHSGANTVIAKGKPANSHIKDPDKIHDSVRRASAIAAASGSVKDHKAAAVAARSASNKFDILAVDHARAGNTVEAKAAQDAAKAYKSLAGLHATSARDGGDSEPHGALTTNSPVRRHIENVPQEEAAPVAAESIPDIEYEKRAHDIGKLTTDEAAGLPLTDLYKYGQGYQGSIPKRGEEVKAALADLGHKSEDARRVQKDYDVGKTVDVENLMKMHEDALHGIKKAAELLKPYAGGVRWNRLKDDADYHETQLRQLENKVGVTSPRTQNPAGHPDMWCSLARRVLPQVT